MIVSLMWARCSTCTGALTRFRDHAGPVHHNRSRGCILIRERQNFKLTRDRLFRREAPALKEVVAGSGTVEPNSESPSVGSKSQIIGAKEQGPIPRALSACLHEVRKRPSSHRSAIARQWHKNLECLICFVTAKRSVTWAAKAHMKLTFERIERTSSTPLCQRLNVIMTRWLGLIQIARNPYRPELHYMRGRGPKWYAKHQGRTENGPL